MQRSHAPLIGIPMAPLREDDRDSATHLVGQRSYSQPLLECGALPVFVPLGAPEEAASWVDRLDGVVLSGGFDVNPLLFGEEPLPGLGVVQRERDDFELAVCLAALERDLPLLGICRGLQVLNVALGGTLVQDIPSQVPGALNHRGSDSAELRHEVELVAGSLLAQTLGAGACSVNSLHHQSISAAGRDLIVTGVCPDDGIIEAAEVAEKRFAVGVQFHPECLPQRFSALFKAFVNACSEPWARRKTGPASLDL